MIYKTPVLANQVHGDSLRVPDVLLRSVQTKILHGCLDVCGGLKLVSISRAATVDANLSEGERTGLRETVLTV